MHRSEYDRLYRIWKAMRCRCNNPNFFEYHRYGGRGIKVCAEWNSYAVFSEWAYSHGYNDNLTIDRIDNDKGYSPSNCRWVSLSEQQHNRSDCRMVCFNGKTQNLSQWARELGFKYDTVKCRMRRGMSFEAAIGVDSV